jgi:hypothetical protein
MNTFARWQRLVLLTLLVLVCSMIPACRPSKVTQDNYDKIKTDMTLQDVETLLGRGTKDEGGDAGAGVAAQVGVDVGGPERGGKGVVTYNWESGNKKITVHFVNGKVTNKQKEGF